MALADGRPPAMRLDVVNEGPTAVSEVELVLAGLDGVEHLAYRGPVERGLTVQAVLPGAGTELRVRVGASENGRSFAGDCPEPQATVILAPFPGHPDVTRIDIRSACPPLPLR
jgi:hypothetical protein